MAQLDRSFRAWGLTGLVAAIAVAGGLTESLGLRAIDEAALIVAAVATFLTLALVTKRVCGAERLVYYHHEIAVVAVCAALAAVLGAPVLLHLDATVVGLGAFLAFGRIGCLRVGCCHGRPARRGIRYGAEHVAAGVAPYLQGVTLLPIQAIESVAVACLVVASGAVALAGAAPGTAAMLYLSGYAVLRFGFEELRGDTARRYWRGLSEAQWISLGVVAAELALAALHVLPATAVAGFAAAALAADGAVVVCRRAWVDSPVEPRRLRELERVARAIATTPPGDAAPTAPIEVWELPGGMRLSTAHVGTVRHVTLSRAPGSLTPTDARHLARVIGATCATPPVDVVDGVGATYHVLMPLRAGPGTHQ